jgi:hypothetical protein
MEPLNRESTDVVAYKGGSFRDRPVGKGLFTCMPMNAITRLSKRYEYGKLKYGMAEAYKDGLPVTDCMDSMFRHLVSYLEGDNTEDHMAAVAWGAFAVMFMEEKRPKFQDVAGRKHLRATSGDFKYLEKCIEKGEFK